MYRNLKTVAVIPAFNEDQKIGQVVRRVSETGFVDKILVVDDGSTDGSVAAARKEGAEVVELGETIGVGAALRAGFEEAKRQQYDCIVILAGNNKDEPKEINRLLDPIADEKADFVQGSRFLKGGTYGGDMPFYRKLATRWHPFVFSIVTRHWVTESTNGFRAFRIKLLDDPRIHLNQDWLNGYELEPYLYYKVVTLGYRTAEVPATKIYPPKKIGYTKMRPFLDWWNILRPLILLPLRLRN